ncbi:hypothetical protein C2R22_15390 [Salinigranum rubrum]|uniref:Uncharacterized protein n=1 Tax=Salinigranum rubrum TaxID=755307 RepID=A0A2I8VLP1_9EURY|nr:T9SS type A sorting domain-containing protein [Salinigranum rubrum]AUV82850.1 hypothetical protein C2R22_15390 [Salinigranum rubrum]
MSVHAVSVLAALLVVLSGTAVGGVPLELQTTGAYAVVTENSVHTPVETVRLGETSVDVSATSPHDGYEPLNVTVVAPADEAVRVELFDANGDRRTALTPSADGTVSIPTDALSSGTYYIAVRAEGQIRAAERAVVSRHDVTFSAIESASTADELRFRIGIIPGGDIPYRDVEVVATDGTDEVVVSATEVRLGLYEATVDRTSLPPGEHAVYARLVGRPGPYVGMSDAVAVTVEGEASQEGQSVTTGTVTDVATEDAESLSTTDGVGVTTTRFPETGVVLLLALLLAGGVMYRVRRRR